MLAAIIGAALVVVLCALVAVALTASREPQGWLVQVLKKRIVVHTRDDQSVEGVLMEQTNDGVILRAATLLGSDGKKTTMAGEVFVPRENIAFAQLDE